MKPISSTWRIYEFVIHKAAVDESVAMIIKTNGIEDDYYPNQFIGK